MSLSRRGISAAGTLLFETWAAKIAVAICSRLSAFNSSDIPSFRAIFLKQHYCLRQYSAIPLFRSLYYIGPQCFDQDQGVCVLIILRAPPDRLEPGFPIEGRRRLVVFRH